VNDAGEMGFLADTGMNLFSLHVNFRLVKDLEGNVSCGREAHFVICCAGVSAYVKTAHSSYGVRCLSKPFH
jgi:hypothetical protein